MKKLNLLILFLGISGLGLLNSACTSQKYFPNHIGVSPSMEWEIQDGNKVKYKPRVGSSVDWNF